jgi:hypothetical protein
MVAMTRGAITVVAAIVVGGCTGGEEQEQVFTPADATRIGNVRPVTPGWTWPKNQDKRDTPDSQTEVQPDPNDILLVEFKKQTANLVEIGEGGSRWRDSNKLANLAVMVFRSASDAHKFMVALNAFSRGWGKVAAGRITKAEEIDGLGDEAWLLWSQGNGTEVTYHWRRVNLFVEAHVHCFGFCPGDVDAAARAWVDAIDEAARAGS